MTSHCLELNRPNSTLGNEMSSHILHPNYTTLLHTYMYYYYYYYHKILLKRSHYYTQILYYLLHFHFTNLPLSLCLFLAFSGLFLWRTGEIRYCNATSYNTMQNAHAEPQSHHLVQAYTLYTVTYSQLPPHSSLPLLLKSLMAHWIRHPAHNKIPGLGPLPSFYTIPSDRWVKLNAKYT